MALKSNGTTIFDAGAIASGFGGSMVFIKKLTASSDATLSFVDGASGVVLDNTYKEYLFTFNNMHPATNSAYLTVGFRDGGTDYDAVKTTTAFVSQHNEAGNSSGLNYGSSWDLAQSTSPQPLAPAIGNQNDECCSGTLHLFNPSGTVGVKHFISNINQYHPDDFSQNWFVAGYCNTTTAIDGVQFKMNTGNIDAGDICLYGIA